MKSLPVNVATKANGKVVFDEMPQLGKVRVPVAGGRRLERRVGSHAVSDQFTFDYAKYAPFVTGDVPLRYGRPRRSRARRREHRSDGEAETAREDGTITAGNAPGVNDGAAALLLADAQYAKEHGYEALATVVDHATVGWDSPYICLTPAMAAQKLLEKHGLSTSDIHVWEINEAFSAVAITSARNLGLGEDAINQVRRRRCDGSPDRRIGRAHRRHAYQSIAQARRRLRHRVDLFRAAAKATRCSCESASSRWHTALPSSVPDKWGPASRRSPRKAGTTVLLNDRDARVYRSAVSRRITKNLNRSVEKGQA